MKGLLTDRMIWESLLFIPILAVYGDVAEGGGVDEASAACSAAETDIAFIIDASGSIGVQNFELVRNFVSEYIGIASVDDGKVRIGILTFSRSFTIYAHLNTYTTARSLQQAVRNISYDQSSTHTATGLWAANHHIFQTQQGDRSDVPNVAILIADGTSNVNRKDTIPQADLLKETGAKIVALGITTSTATKGELDNLASLPLSKYRTDVDDFTKLAGLSESIQSATCADTTTTTAATTTTTTSTTTSSTTTSSTTMTTKPDTTPTTSRTTTLTTSTSATTITTPDTTPTTSRTTTSATSTTSSSTTTTSTTTTTTPVTTPTRSRTTTSATSTTSTLTVAMASRPISTRPDVGPSTKPDSTVCLDNPLDIAFVVDTSSSVGNDHFRLVIDYIKSVVSTTDIDGGKVRAAVLTFSTDTTVHINLNDFKRKKEFYGAVDGIPYVQGWTNAAEAFQALRTQVFTSKSGDRENVQNVVLMITDGRSNIDKDRVVQEASEVKKSGTHVLAVGVGLASLEEVDNIVTSPASENRFTVASYDDLRGLGEVLFPFLCQDRRVTGDGGAPEPTASTTHDVSTTGGTLGGPSSGTEAQNMTMSTPIPVVMKTRQLQCHDWCDDNQEERPTVNIDDLVKNLTLPKASLSKQQRAKGSAIDESPVVNSLGKIVFALMSTPFFIFVGWDILNLAGYLRITRK